jgi:hypothetical protein
MKRLVQVMYRILLILIGIIAFSGGAQAHAFLDTASPSVGGTLRAAPAQVNLTFTQALEPAFSTVRVEDAAGKQVDKKDGAVSSDNPKALHISLPPLPPGTYQVFWRVLSVDSHVTEGKFKFTIAQ